MSILYMVKQQNKGERKRLVPRLFSCKNLLVTSPPKERPTPRLLGPLPGWGCGSLHNNSHINPERDQMKPKVLNNLVMFIMYDQGKKEISNIYLISQKTDDDLS